jgi:hypothetical protein
MGRDGDGTDLAAGDVEELCGDGGEGRTEFDDGTKVGLVEGFAVWVDGVARWVFGGAGDGEGEAVRIVV